MGLKPSLNAPNMMLSTNQSINEILAFCLFHVRSRIFRDGDVIISGEWNIKYSYIPFRSHPMYYKSQ